MCPKKTVDPLSQPVVSNKSTVYPSKTVILNGSTSEVEVKQGVDQCKVFEVNDLDSVDYVNNSDQLGWKSDIKFWEVKKIAHPAK